MKAKYNKGWNADESGLGLNIVVSDDLIVSKSGYGLIIRWQFGSTEYELIVYRPVPGRGHGDG